MRALACAVLLAAFAVPAGAQSRRPPTPEEKAVLTTFYDALNSVLAPFEDVNWGKSDDFLRGPEHASISIHAGVPLDNCLGGDRTYQVKPNSPRFNTLLKPLYERAQKMGEELGPKVRAGTATAEEINEMQQIGNRAKELSTVRISVCANSPNVEKEELSPGTPSLVDGVVAHKLASGAYVFVYGDWSTARLSKSGRLYDFKFVHPAASPFIENVVVTMSGAADRTEEMLKTADWKKLNDGLTR